MDANRAKITARQWDQAGPGCAIDLFARKGLVAESQRKWLAAFIRHEQAWLVNQIRGQESLSANEWEHHHRGQYRYGERDAEDLVNWLEVVESASMVTDADLTKAEQAMLQALDGSEFNTPSIAFDHMDSPLTKKVVKILGGKEK